MTLMAVVPKELIHQTIACPQGSRAKVDKLQVLGTQYWSDGVVLLYSGLCPSEKRPKSRQRVFGHKVIKRVGFDWKVSGSDSYRSEAPKSASNRLLHFGTHRWKDANGDRYAILYGQILSPKVMAIEATFDNGRVLRESGQNGTFALVAPKATAVCEIRLLGADEQILQQKNLAMPKWLVNYGQTHRCSPVLEQLKSL